MGRPHHQGLPPSQLNVGAVRFTLRARSVWHSHDGGQTLYITEGLGLVQVRGQQIVELNPGDVVFAPHGKEHKISAIGLGCMGLSANYGEAEPDNMHEAEL